MTRRLGAAMAEVSRLGATAVPGLMALTVMILSPAAAAAASGPPAIALRDARLAGRFRLSGVVTDAAGVRGERRGELVSRTWVFAGACARTPCPSATLVRARSGGSDRLTLRRRELSLYAGSGSFVLPLSCGGRHYAGGEIVPFSVTVRVTGVRATAFGILASSLRASYVSRSRRNLTPCVLVPAHDAARYTGTLS